MIYNVDMKVILHDKATRFALRIIRLYQYLVNEQREYVMSKQILRSATSVGANLHESINAQSKADFIHKRSISLKEADETQYWLTLLFESEYINQELYSSLYTDIGEIIAMLSRSIKTAKRNLELEKKEKFEERMRYKNEMILMGCPYCLLRREKEEGIRENKEER